MVIFRRQLLPGQVDKQLAQKGDIVRACGAESLLPAHLRRKEARTVEVPDRIVAEKLAAGAAEYGPVGLPPNLIRRRIVLALVGGFQQNKRANRLA